LKMFSPFTFAGLEDSMTPQGHDKTRCSSPAWIKR